MLNRQCTKMRGYIAAAAYDALEEGDQELLEAHLRSCPECRTEADELGTFVAALPRERPELGLNLAPLLRRRLAQEPVGVRGWNPRWRWALSAVLVLLVAAVGLRQWGTSIRYTPAADTNAASFALEEALHLAATFEQQNNYVESYDVLRRAVDAFPKEPRAGEAQMRLADIAYSKLHWYDRADQDYRRLVAEYQDTIQASEDWGLVLQRRELLAEARRDDYAVLHELDEAGQNPTTAFERLEKIIARDSTSEVATQAMNRMLALVDQDSPSSEPQTRLKLLQAARDRCSDDRARGKLDFEIGDLAFRKLENRALAMEAYGRASESPDPRLAQRARESLVALRVVPR